MLSTLSSLSFLLPTPVSSFVLESDPPLRQIHSDLPMFKTNEVKARRGSPPKFSGETRTRTERHVARARNNRNHHDGRHSGEALVGQLPDAAGPHPALQVRCPPKEFKDFAFRLNLGRVRARDGVGWSRASPRVGPRPPCAVYHAFVPLLRALSLTRAIFANPRRSLSLLSPQFQARKHCERHGSARGSLHGRRGD